MRLKVENISFKYNNNLNVLNELSFKIDVGNILTILGTNGAGKSTLLNCIAGINKVLSGEIKIDDVLLYKYKSNELSKKIAYVAQNQHSTFPYSVIEYVVMGRSPYISAFSKPSKVDYDIAVDKLSELGIYKLKDQLFTEISGGERQQVAIARALTQQPEIILLDEPTAHLDYGNQYRVINIIKNLAKKGFTIVLTTHNPEHAMILGGDVAILNKEHKFYTGHTKEVLNDKILTNLYELDIKTLFIDEIDRSICYIK